MYIPIPITPCTYLHLDVRWEGMKPREGVKISFKNFMLLVKLHILFLNFIYFSLFLERHSLIILDDKKF